MAHRRVILDEQKNQVKVIVFYERNNELFLLKGCIIFYEIALGVFFCTNLRLKR